MLQLTAGNTSILSKEGSNSPGQIHSTGAGISSSEVVLSDQEGAHFALYILSSIVFIRLPLTYKRLTAAFELSAENALHQHVLRHNKKNSSKVKIYNPVGIIDKTSHGTPLDKMSYVE